MLNSLKKTKYVVANSEFTKNLAIEKGVDENKLVIINPGTDINENEDLDEHSALLGSKIFYIGDVDYLTLLSLFKRSSTFVHLAYLDHCPNVVVDAQASGCHIVCSSTGGTSEIVTKGTIIAEDDWNFEPTELYNPPKMNFDSYFEINLEKVTPDINQCAKSYYSVFQELLKK